jgi:hypothetical protein
MSSGTAAPAAADVRPSHPFVTTKDHTSLLNVMGWFLVVVVVLVVLTRLGTRRAKSRTIGLDDYAIILSTVRSSSDMLVGFPDNATDVRDRPDGYSICGRSEWVGPNHWR